MIKNISIKALTSMLYFIIGMGLLLALWYIVSKISKNEVPSPADTWLTFKEVMQNPMQNDPDITGIGTKLLSSLKRVGMGFGLGSLVAIPLGLLMGNSKIVMNIFNPIVQILKPVSP